MGKIDNSENKMLRIPLSLLLIFTLGTSYATVPNYKNLKQQIEGNRKLQPPEAVADFLYDSLLKLFPYWYGTKWDFNGTSETPNRGKIACGYFISTLLRDAGFRLNRYKLAQQSAEGIVRNLTSHYRWYAKQDVKKMLGEIEEGQVYVVGLTNHVGFLVKDKTKVYFVHSSYFDPAEVVREIASMSTILLGSSVYILGNITADATTLKKYQKGQSFKVRSKFP